MRIAILDDYQGVALRSADWSRLPAECRIDVFRQPLGEEDAVAAALADFDCICLMRERTAFPASLIARLPKLRLLVTSGMRNAAIDVAAAKARGIAVCGAESRNTATAELAWGLLLSLARNIGREDRALRAGRWQDSVGVELEGKVLGIVGLGKLGSRVAAFGRAFGMRVIAWSQNLDAARATAAGAELVGKAELFATADFVTIHLVSSARTRGLIGITELNAMKPSAFLINTARAAIVDQAALLTVLRERRIAGAGLDVYDIEPLPADSPFRHLDNAILLPHLGYVTEETYRAFYAGMLEDIIAWMAGQPIRLLA